MLRAVDRRFSNTLTRCSPPLPIDLERVAADDSDHDRALDPIPGRERYYRQHIDSRRWLRVVVDFDDDPGWIVTVAVQTNDPRKGR